MTVTMWKGERETRYLQPSAILEETIGTLEIWEKRCNAARER